MFSGISYAQNEYSKDQFEILDEIEGDHYEMYKYNESKNKWVLEKGYGREYEKVVNSDGTYDIVQIKDDGSKLQYYSTDKVNPYSWEYKSYNAGYGRTTLYRMIFYKSLRFNVESRQQGSTGKHWDYESLYCSDPNFLKGKTREDIIEEMKVYIGNLYAIDQEILQKKKEEKAKKIAALEEANRPFKASDFSIEGLDITKIELRAKSPYKYDYTFREANQSYEIIATDAFGIEYSTNEYKNYQDYDFDLHGFTLQGNWDLVVNSTPNLETCQATVTVSSKYQDVKSNTIKHWLYFSHNYDKTSMEYNFEANGSIPSDNSDAGKNGTRINVYLQQTGYVHPENNKPIYVIKIVDQKIGKTTKLDFFQTPISLEIECNGGDAYASQGMKGIMGKVISKDRMGGPGGQGGEINIFYDPEVPWDPNDSSNKFSVEPGNGMYLDLQGNEKTKPENNEGPGTFKITEKIVKWN